MPGRMDQMGVSKTNFRNPELVGVLLMCFFNQVREHGFEWNLKLALSRKGGVAGETPTHQVGAREC